MGLTPDQFTVMRTLLEQHGITQRRLATLISSDANTVASLVNRMEKAGLIERETHEQDGRANRLGVSRRGKAKYEQAREIAVALQGEVLGRVARNDAREFPGATGGHRRGLAGRRRRIPAGRK